MKKNIELTVDETGLIMEALRLSITHIQESIYFFERMPFNTKALEDSQKKDINQLMELYNKLGNNDDIQI